MGHAKTAVVLLLSIVSLAASPASQPAAAEDFPALRKRLAAALAENSDLVERIKVLEAQISSLRQQVAAAMPTPKQDGRAARLHAFAIDGRKLFHGMKSEDVAKAIGEPDEKSRTNRGWRWVYAEGSYQLSLDVYNGEVDAFTEAGAIPK